METIKVFSNGGKLFYSEGNFDKWCVYYESGEKPMFPPTDKYYFKYLLRSSRMYSTIYDDLFSVFNQTTDRVEEEVLQNIVILSQKYGAYAIQFEILFTVIYCAMISEEKKEHTRLGKRIKMLGIHQLLKENFSVDEAADFSRNKSWKVLAAECNKYGF
ncbi:hypothetical protein ACM39_01730 [Chryseobacterium sp. FH2]|uniref:DUF7004 family protein n=1 Tax=Chryseobacterium sp. FH2 TaxID=1674291 RepID=UPI00065AF3C9|nr:hypothetical protein [Chryseobacterium sp. FH2]KMQ69794.1 hypothetical protein ACM39_01730 [Chryseobacterium sp. FH2]